MDLKGIRCKGEHQLELGYDGQLHYLEGSAPWSSFITKQVMDLADIQCMCISTIEVSIHVWIPLRENAVHLNFY
jgi:hypothetical protein